MNNDSRDNSTTKSKEVIYFYDKTKGLSTMPDDESDTSDLELDKSARRSICSEQGGQVKVIEPNLLNWSDWFRYKADSYGSSAVETCDVVGSYLAGFFGITTPKYQYEIDYHNSIKEMEKEISDIELGTSISNEA